MVPFLFFKLFLMEVTADQTETNSSILRKHFFFFFFFFFKGHVSGAGGGGQIFSSLFVKADRVQSRHRLQLHAD